MFGLFDRIKEIRDSVQQGLDYLDAFREEWPEIVEHIRGLRDEVQGLREDVNELLEALEVLEPPEQE